jgi:hypothetical protein
MSAVHRCHLPAAIGLLIASSASAQPALIMPRDATQRAWVEAVTKRMSSCFTALGPRTKFPEVATLPPSAEMIAGVLMPVTGMLVNDGYNYMLMLHGPSNAGYVVQLGGFAGRQTLFGPLRLDIECNVPALPAAKSSDPASTSSTTTR